MEDLTEYSQGMLAAYDRKTMRGEFMWLYFITVSRPHTVCSWTRPMISEWRDILTKRGIYLDMVRTRVPAETMIDVIFR